MSVFRLQTFAPGGVSVGPRISDADRRLATARDEAYRAGFVAGQAAATEVHLEDQTRLSSALIEALEDARLTNEAARRHVAASIAPLVQAICGTLAPALAQAGLLPEIARRVEAVLEAAPAALPRLRCAPELVAPVTALLAERSLAADVQEAPELLPREVQLFWAQGYDHLDLDACAAQVLACLGSHLSPGDEGEADDGARRHG